MNTILGQKKAQSEKFLQDGTRVPVTIVDVSGNRVLCIKNKDKNGYTAVQLGVGFRKNPNKALLGHIKGATDKAPYFIREARVDEEEALPVMGSLVLVEAILKPGDIVEVTGTSKGKGFAGVVKRHHFRGGPRTHGQSDRERAPGSIGQTTTPGRVYRGKRMAGHMGEERVTVKNLMVVDIEGSLLYIKGLIPGSINGYVVVRKISEGKKFIPIHKVIKADSIPQQEPQESQEELQEETQKEPQQELQAEESTTEPKAASAESFGEPKEEQENA